MVRPCAVLRTKNARLIGSRSASHWASGHCYKISEQAHPFGNTLSRRIRRCQRTGWRTAARADPSRCATGSSTWSCSPGPSRGRQYRTARRPSGARRNAEDARRAIRRPGAPTRRRSNVTSGSCQSITIAATSGAASCNVFSTTARWLRGPCNPEPHRLRPSILTSSTWPPLRFDPRECPFCQRSAPGFRRPPGAGRTAATGP